MVQTACWAGRHLCFANLPFFQVPRGASMQEMPTRGKDADVPTFRNDLDLQSNLT